MPSPASSLRCRSRTAEGAVESIGERGVFFATPDLELDVDEGSEVTLCVPCRKDGAAFVIERTGCVMRAERYFDGTTIMRAFAIRFHGLIATAGFDFA